MQFEWDERKNQANIAKHGIDFEDAATIFDAPHIVKRSDSHKEERWLATGEVEGRKITVVYTMRWERLRIISARKARKNE